MSNNQIMPAQPMTAGTLTMTVDYNTLNSRIAQLQQFIKDYMVPGEDYGKIEGINKPILLKPGAEKLCDVYGLAVGAPIIKQTRDDSRTPVYLHYEVITPLMSRIDGTVLMHGVGSCNSYEKKYKYRWVFQSELTNDMDPRSLKTRQVGSEKQYTQYQIPNDEIDDLDNTFLKMAKKRSLIDAVLSATRSSALFTQDVEDMPGMEIKQQDTTQRNEQRQQRGSQNQQSQRFGSKNNEVKNKALDMRKTMRLEWEDLAEIASSALGRKISRVIQDIKTPDEWTKVYERLQTMDRPA